MKILPLANIILLTVLSTSYGQTFHETIQRVYGGFIPHKTSRADINKKIVQLDSLFKVVQSDTTKYLPLLRDELIQPDNPPYFYWDGAELLLSTKSKGAEKLFIQSVKKTDMEDMDTDIYWHRIRYLALNGFDISDLAIKILDVEDFKAVIYEHAFTIDKDYCLYYLLIPLTPDKYVDKLIERHKNEKNASTKEIIIKMLWRSRSCLANSYLMTLEQDLMTNQSTKEQIKKMNIKNISDTPPDSKYQKDFDRQKEVYRFITDYTIKEIDGLTKRLRKYNCL